MKTITRLLATAALLFGVLGGVSSVKAEKVKLYSSAITKVNADCDYDTENHLFTWNGTGNNTARILQFDAGLLAYFTKLHIACGVKTVGGNYRVLIGDGTKWQQFYYDAGTADIDIIFATNLTSEQISGATEIRIAGNSSVTETQIAAGINKHKMEILPSNIYLESDRDLPFAIASASDWKAFSLLVSNGLPSLNATLTASIEVTDGTMIGTGSNTSGSENPKAYSGTFDGQNFTITYTNSQTTEKVTAPFRFVKGGTIKNLKTAGSMSSTQNIMGGIAGFVQGTVLIDNCSSSMNLTSGDAVNDATIGGILGLQDKSPTALTVTNCMYTGTLTGDHGVSGIAGYMRYGDGATFRNILYAGSYVTENDNPVNMENIVRGGGTCTKCYYVSKIAGNTSGTEATSAMLTSGQVTYNLQGNQATQYWGQDMKTASSNPMLTSDPAYKVFDLGGGEYANWTNTISDDADWVIFSKLVAAGTTDMDVTMTADINVVNTMVGSETAGKRYQGTFDGAGHTLTFTYSGSAEKVAPFQAVEGATIRNLKTTGSITSSGNLPAGIAGQIYGTTTIENCSSDMNLSTTATSNGRIGGLVSRCKESGAVLNLKNCLFNGTLSTATTGSGMICGLVGYSADQTVNLSSCFVNPTSITGTGDQRFCHTRSSVNNCWYNSVLTTGVGGTEATSAKIESGEVTYDLQNTQATQYWGQDMKAVPSLPMLTSDPAYKVNKIGDSYYANQWDNTISDYKDWVTFSEYVKSGTTNINVTMTANVSVGSTMVGTATYPYQGKFDGAGHTLTFTYDGTEQFAAPFQYVNNATISDLKTTGYITTTNNQCGGIIGRNTGGNTTMNRCMSSATIESKTVGNGRAGGLAGRCTDGTLTFNYCMYDGEITCSGEQGASGFVGYCDDISTKININYCLVAVASDKKSGDDQNFVGGYKGEGEIVFTNAYYLNMFGSSGQGTQMTDQLRYSGQAAYTLNQGIGEGAWFFGQGYLNSSRVEDTPTLTSVASKRVYKDTGTDTRYANAGGMLPDPALNNQLSWKFTPSGDADCVYMLPADHTGSFTLYGTSEAYVLRVTAAGATTLILPFNVESLPAGVKAYNLSFDGSVINANKVSSITADKPVLINALAGDYVIECEAGVWGQFNYKEEHTSTTNGALTGVYCTDGIPFKYVPTDKYVLQNGEDGLGFYQVDAANKIKITSFRAYLTASTEARSLRIVYNDDEPTGVGAALMNYEARIMNNEVYNLCGQRVEKATKGLYIKNGKKVIMK